MIGIALSLASRIVSGPRAQKVMAWIIIAAFIALVAWGAWIIAAGWIAAGKRDAVDQDRQDATLNAITIQRDADNAAAWFDQSAAIERERERANLSEAINASVSDPDGDPLGDLYNRMR